MYCHFLVNCSSLVSYKATEQQCTSGSKYRLASASDLGSAQVVNCERSVHWNCGGGSRLNRLGSLRFGCDVRLLWSRLSEMRSARGGIRPRKLSHTCYVWRDEKMNIYCKREKININENFIHGWLVKRTCLNICLLIYSIQQSPSWQANRFVASLEIHIILWNPTVYYHMHT